MNYKLLTYIIISSLLSFQSLHAQTPTVQSLIVDDGLSQGMIFDILKDSDGFIWFATKNGLNRYDGYNFKVFTHNPYDSLSLSGDEISTLFEDSKGRIWVGTIGKGINWYDKKTGKFHRIIDKTSLSLSQTNAYNIEEDKNGKVWVSGNKGFLMSLEDKGNNDFDIEIHDTKQYNLDNKIIYTIKSMNNGKLLIGVEQLKNDEEIGVYEWNEQKKTLTPFSFHKDLDKKTIINIIETPNNGLWIITIETIYRIKNGILTQMAVPEEVQKKLNTRRYSKLITTYDAASQKIWFSYYISSIVYELDLTKEKLESKPILTFEDKVYVPVIFIDENRLAWFGTNGYGVRKMMLQSPPFKHFLPQKSVRFIHQTEQGDLFLNHRTMMEVLPKNQKTFIPITEFSNIPQKKISGIIQRNNTFWVADLAAGPDLLGLHQLDANFKVLKSLPLPHSYLQYGQFHEDEQGNLWLCKVPFGLLKINTRTGVETDILPSKSQMKSMDEYLWVYHLYIDNKGVFWKSTDNGLFRIEVDKDGKVVNYQQFKNDVKSIKSINNNVVASVIDDPKQPNDILWIATKGGGLNKLNKKTGTFEHYTIEDGLPDNVIYGILPDEDNNLWLSTNRGLSKFNPITKTFVNFRKSDGLQDDEFNTAAFFKNQKTGELFFGGINGVTAFYPKDVKLSNYQPNVYIVGLKINQEKITVGKSLENGGKNPLKRPIELTKKIKLAWHQNHIELEFAALDYLLPNKNLYQYQLVGVDKNWVQVRDNRIANYANLGSGKYIFKVKGSNSSGVWNKTERVLEIVIYPPWWKTKIAYLLYFLFLIGILYTIYCFQLNRIKLKNDLLFEQKEAARLVELDNIKTNFFSNITHEFRTPLTLIIEPLRQLIHDYPKNPLIDKVKLAKSNSEKLMGLINQLLDLSKLEQEQMKLELKTGNIIKVIEPIVESFQLIAQQKEVQLTFDAPKHIESFSFDKDKIEKILFNLISNAIKFTKEQGKITVNIEINSISESLKIAVTDNGIGIKASEQQKVFERFYQVDGSNTRKQQGTGIGLALCIELTQVMNGMLTLESKLGKGSRFDLVIPMVLAKSNSSSFSISEPYIESSLLVKKVIHNDFTSINTELTNLVLLIEDNDELRQFIKSSISDNYQIIEANNGKTGLDLAIKYMPNIIISDVMMPEMDGFEICQRLKTNEKTAHIPIILLTAKTALDSKIQGLKYGADTYMNKPFNTEELLVRIKNLLDNRQKIQQKYKEEFQRIERKKISADTSSEISVYDQYFLKNAYAIIEKELDNETFTIELFAQQIAMSRTQLHRKLKALLNQSASEFIRNIRLNKAKEYLEERKGNVTEVAFMVGFSNSKYFSTKFKEKFGISPREI